MPISTSFNAPVNNGIAYTSEARFSWNTLRMVRDVYPTKHWLHYRNQCTGPERLQTSKVNAIDDVIGGEPIGLIFQSQESE
jgi:hypothetical protein